MIYITDFSLLEAGLYNLFTSVKTSLDIREDIS